MAGNEHFMFKRETQWGTYVAPDVALPVTSASPNPTQPPLVNEDTGGGRGQRPSLPGAKTVEGPVLTHLYGKDLGKLLRSMYGTRAKAAASTGWLNKLLPNDDVDFDSFSFQKRYRADAAESIRGAKLNGYTVTARSREFATVETRWVAKDASSTTGGWADANPAVTVITSNSVASPTSVLTATAHGLTTGDRVRIAGVTGSTPSINGDFVITVVDPTHFTIPVNVTVGGTGGTVREIGPAVIDPPPYTAGMPDPLKFNQGVLRLGGTATLVSGAVSISGGTDRCDFDNVQLEVNNNLSNNAFGICLGDPTVQSVDEGRRTVMLRFEPNFALVTEGSEFYDKWGDGTDVTAELYFQTTTEFATGFPYKFIWGLPLIRITNAPMPELNAQFGLKRQTVEATAYVQNSLAVGLDHGLQIQTTDDYTT